MVIPKILLQLKPIFICRLFILNRLSVFLEEVPHFCFERRQVNWINHAAKNIFGHAVYVKSFIKLLEDLGIVEVVNFGTQNKNLVRDGLETAQLIGIGHVVVEVRSPRAIARNSFGNFVDDITECLANTEDSLPSELTSDSRMASPRSFGQ